MPLESWKRTPMSPRWGTLQRDPDTFYSAMVEMMCSSMRVPVAMISVFKQGRHFVRAAHGLCAADVAEIPISHSLCQHVVAMGRPLVINDAIAHPLVCDSPAIGEFGIAAYLGEPLHGLDGKPMGAMCAFDTRARDWAENHRRMFSITAMIVEKALTSPEGEKDFPIN